MTQVTDSYIAMFKGMIALAWADGVLDGEEQDRLHDYIDANGRLNDTQKETLRDAVDEEILLTEVWSDITDPQHRAHLINIATTVFHEDGSYSEAEKKAYARITGLHNATLDEDALRAEIGNIAAVARERWEQEDQDYMNSLSFPARMIEYLETVLD